MPYNINDPIRSVDFFMLSLLAVLLAMVHISVINANGMATVFFVFAFVDVVRQATCRDTLYRVFIERRYF
jgi:hypothetical protein